MKMDSWKKSMQTGFLLGFVTYAVWFVFTIAVYYLCGRENYIESDSMREVINGFSFMHINVFGAIAASLVPFFVLRYDEVKYVLLCVITAPVMYLFLFFITLVVPEVLFGGLDYPLETFDAKFYATMTFPLGSIIGTLWSVVFKALLKPKQKLL